MVRETPGLEANECRSKVSDNCPTFDAIFGISAHLVALELLELLNGVLVDAVMIHRHQQRVG